MRIWVLGAVGAAGCNQIFGLDDTRLVDAVPVVLPEVRLTLQVAATAGAEPDPALEFPPLPVLPEPPRVRLGGLDEPLAPASYQDTGEIEFPAQLLGTTWRLEYTLPGGVPTEVQWTPRENRGHIVVPVFGRLERRPVPDGGGYAITPVAATATPPATFRAPRVLTTGIWSDTGLAATASGTVAIDMSEVAPLSGSPGEPDAARGDVVILIENEAGACTRTAGSAELAPPALAAGTNQPVAPAWTNLPRTAVVGKDELGVAGVRGRLGSALQPDRVGLDGVQRLAIGHVPSQLMPALSQGPIGRTPAPAMLALVDCPFGVGPGALPTYALPLALSAFPAIVYGQFANVRRASPTGPELVSSMVAVGLSTVQDKFNLELGVPFAIAPIALRDRSTGDLVADLAGELDRVPLAAGGAPLELTFTLEPVGQADYFEVTLFTVTATLDPVRAFVVTDVVAGPPGQPDTGRVQLDRDVLTAGAEHVLSIRVRRGAPGVKTGDFAQVMYPQAASTIFTRTFVAP